MYRKPVIAAAILIAGLATGARGAVTYDFRQISQSDFQNSSDGEVHGSVTIDGTRSRIELKKGSGHPPGTYIISRNDSQTVLIVDPVNKRFTEVDASKIVSAFGSARVQISNLRSDVKKLPDHAMVAGLPTDHYRVTASYDITVLFGLLPLRQEVVTTIDKWVTSAFAELADPTSRRAALRTGNASVDALIEAELMKVKGFPLREITTIQTTMSDAGDPSPRSQIKLKPTRKQTTEMLITRINNVTVNSSLFEVPASYAKMDSTAEGETPTVQMLTMEP